MTNGLHKIYDSVINRSLLVCPGPRRCPSGSPQLLPDDTESSLERPSDVDGDDSRHPDVHGPCLRAAERRGQRVQFGLDYFQRSGKIR
jgi:hypothetical protein